MKQIFAFLTFLPCLLFAQDYKKMYYSENWKGTSKEHGVYYRTSGFNDTLSVFEGEVEDFYVKNNQKEMEGFYLNGKKNGVFTFYFPNGNIRFIAGYKNNQRNGTWIEYFENGNIKLELNYLDGKELIMNYNDINGTSKISDGKFILQQNDLKITGDVEANLKTGTWKIQTQKYGTANLKYKNGILIKGTAYYRNKKRKVFDNLAYPLIPEPRKFYNTENFNFEFGEKIRNNYVLEGRYRHKFISAKKIQINSKKELENHIRNRLEIINTESEKHVEIVITVKNSIPIKCETIPKLTKSELQELELIMSIIERINYVDNEMVSVEYIVQKENRLN